MGNQTPPTWKSRRWLILLTAVLAFSLFFLLVQSFVSNMAAGTAVSFSRPVSAQTITPTVPFTDALAAYIDAHFIEGDVMPTPMPAPETAVEPPVIGPTPTMTYSVALLGNNMRMGAPGQTVAYSLVLSNTGLMTDVYDITTSTSAWATAVTPSETFTLTGGAYAELTVSVSIPGNAPEGSDDNVTVTATSRTDPQVDDALTLTTTAGFYYNYLAVNLTSLPTPSLSATRPNSFNDWQMNWTIEGNPIVDSYELEQSQDPSFTTGVAPFILNGDVNTQLIAINQPSPNNVYYYRVRALGQNQYSEWSNVVRVVGAYEDNFTNNQTGWSGPTLKEGLRRLTFIEEIDTWYENNDWLIIRVEDSWDWAIASPLKPAPELPYKIEFRSQPANLGNLVSHGVVFGGDWTGAPCPDWSSVIGVYAHTNCFNHFYNSNLIWYGENDLKMLWERVDVLIYCPDCGGSPLKRLGDIDPENPIEFEVNANGWNDYRIEVREDNIQFYLNGDLKLTYNDTRWVHDPYFGVFASTDEYSNSTWRYEYFRVTPLDN